MSDAPKEEHEEGGKSGGQVMIDLLVRIWLLLPIPAAFSASGNLLWIGVAILICGLALYALSSYMSYRQGKEIAKLLVIVGIFIAIISFFMSSGLSAFNIPTTIYSLAQIISVQLLPLSAFPALEAAATWVLWVFIALMFAQTDDWKQLLMMLAIGGIAMGFIGSLGIFAVADAEVTASYTDLVQNSKVKNQTASGVSNVWLMLSNPRLWYEQTYGYNNQTLAEGDQMSPFALEITKAEVLEKEAPPDGDATLDIQVKNKGLRKATLKRIEVAVEDANIGPYDRYTKDVATIEKNHDAGYLYFESTPTLEAHYQFCDNPYGGEDADGFVWSATSGGEKNYAKKEFTNSEFEPGIIDEYFVDLQSPKCFGTQKVNATATYSYEVTATYNLELINNDYFKELAKYNKLKFHTESSKSTEGPLKLSIRSVPEAQPVRVDNGFTVFYSISNVGPGTAIIRNRGAIKLEALDATGLTISPDACDFEETVGANYLKNGAINKFYTIPSPGGADECTFEKDKKKVCALFSEENPSNVVLLKCTFTHPANVDTTKTLFMKLHVKYDYMTTQSAQYKTTEMPDFHGCVTKRALDGFPNKTSMDLYLKEVFKDATIGVGASRIQGLFSGMGPDGLDQGISTRVDLCPDKA